MSALADCQTIEDQPRAGAAAGGVFALLLSCSVIAAGWGLAGGTASAATVLLKNGDVLHGFIKQETIDQIILETVVNGRPRSQVISRDRIDDVLRHVDPQRLAELSPLDPQQYRLYAEELAGKKLDPEAREAALRLYLISAYLNPQQQGRSCLLGMAGVARSPLEKRRIHAMLYLLDPEHDPKLLEGRTAAPPPSAPGVDVAEQTVALLRAIRNRDLSDAQRLLKLPAVAAEIDALADTLSRKDIREAMSRECTHCDKGWSKCTRCGGTGVVDGRRCSECVSGFGTSRTTRGRVRCPICEGDYRHAVLSPEQLRKLLTAELKVEGALDEAPVAASEAEAAPWNPVDGSRPPSRRLTLRTLTEFDPQNSVYRRGRWVAPETN
jgi:hypothetical protein